MHRFYVAEEQMNDNMITITGPDVNHLKNVLRMKVDDELVICNGQGKDCYCIIKEMSERQVIAEVKEIKNTDTELKTKITLFQGLPKKDKMELIIQKAVELGVYEIVPVMTKRVIVKLEDKKKEERKLERWQMIAESAAKQSRRGIIPVIKPVISYEEALKAASSFSLNVIPYENAEGIQHTKDIIQSLPQHPTLGIFIGPEGGFEEIEIEKAQNNNVIPITLGKRILRTETAGLAVLSMAMLTLEE